ncbi:hypothetical protein [Peribacillus frigoritolerans]|uniref:hypothetical protein n=1 Tax=Peribacillus frigoritolerans TaxID=450367 RepID=UPI003422A0DF
MQRKEIKISQQGIVELIKQTEASVKQAEEARKETQILGILIDLGMLYIAFILLVICVLAAIPVKWFRDWLWSD